MQSEVDVMRKRLIVLFAIACLISCGAERGERVNTVDTSGMVTMYTTAYNLHGITANGGTTRPNIAACNGHLGEIAILYTMEGEYLTTVEITDTGGSDGMKAGKVVDVWFDTYEECVAWMLKVADSGGKCKVLFIKGQG